MLRSAIALLVVSLAPFAPAGCGGDDTVNPTNPDASSGAKVVDASSDGAREGAASDAAGAHEAGSGGGEAGSAAGDAALDATQDAQGSSESDAVAAGDT